MDAAIAGVGGPRRGDPRGLAAARLHHRPHPDGAGSGAARPGLSAARVGEAFRRRLGSVARGRRPDAAGPRRGRRAIQRGQPGVAGVDGPARAGPAGGAEPEDGSRGSPRRGGRDPISVAQAPAARWLLWSATRGSRFGAAVRRGQAAAPDFSSSASQVLDLVGGLGWSRPSRVRTRADRDGLAGRRRVLR